MVVNGVVVLAGNGHEFRPLVPGSGFKTETEPLPSPLTVIRTWLLTGTPGKFAAIHDDRLLRMTASGSIVFPL
jgi:hypothetical protein